MKLKTLISHHKAFWWIAFPAGGGIALTAQWVATACGLGLTFDSQLFLAGAQFFNGGVAGSLTEQAVFQAKPPLFSFVLAWFSLETLPYFYRILLFANLYLLASTIRLIFTSNYWQIVTFMAIALFAPFVMVHVYLWTEPIFLIFFYLAILVLLKSRRTGFASPGLVVLAILFVLMILTRHVGLFLVLGMSIAIAFETSGGWKKGLLVLLPALLIFSCWNFGLMTTGISGRLDTLVSPLTGGTWSRLQNFQYFFATASTWLLPNSVNELLRRLIFAGVIIFLAYQIRQNKPQQSRLLLIISLTYYLLMHISFLIDPTSADRYLVPVYPLMLMVAFYLLAQYSQQKRAWLKYLVLVWLLYPAGRVIKNSIFWQEKICQENKGEVITLNQDNSRTNDER